MPRCRPLRDANRTRRFSENMTVSFDLPDCRFNAGSEPIVELQIELLGGQFHATVKIFKELFCGFMQTLGEIPGRNTKGLHLINGEPIAFDTVTDADRAVSFNLGVSWR